MANRTTKTVRSAVVGFVAGVAALGVVATAQPLHRAVSTAIGNETTTSVAAAPRHHRATQPQSQQLWSPPQAQPQDQNQWIVPQQQQQQYVQPAPQQAPQSQAS